MSIKLIINKTIMKKSDIIASLILGEIVAIFLFFILRGLGFILFPLGILFIVLPIFALIGIWVAFLIGRKISVVFQFAKYATVGFANTAVDFGVLNFLMWSTDIYKGKEIFFLNSISFLVAVTHSYAWNKLWTFRAQEKDVGGQFVQFLGVTLIGLLINGGIVYTITTWISPMFGVSIEVWANIAKVVATAVSLIWNFIGYKFIVFKKSRTKNYERVSDL